MDDQRADVSGGQVITRTSRIAGNRADGSSQGERRVAEVLTSMAGVEVLHDRRATGVAATIAHIVVGPNGVYVVSARKDEGRVERRQPRRRADERLYVHGRDCTAVVDGVLDQVDVVRNALGVDFPGVDVRGVLCFVGCSWGVRMRPKVVKGVTSVWPIALPLLVSAPGPHSAAMPAIAERLRSRLPAAT